MRLIAATISIGLALASCHSNKPAEDPESASNGESGESTKTPGTDTSESKALGENSGGTSTPRGDKATVRDDSEKSDEAPCRGDAIADLLASLSQASCELAPNAPAPDPAPTKNTLDVRVSADSRVAPGAATQVTIIFRNKRKGPPAARLHGRPGSPLLIRALYAQGGPGGQASRQRAFATGGGRRERSIRIAHGSRDAFVERNRGKWFFPGRR